MHSSWGYCRDGSDGMMVVEEGDTACRPSIAALERAFSEMQF